MSTPELYQPSFPVTLIPGYASKEETNVQLRCHDHWFQDATVLQCDTGATLFKLKSKYGKSWSLRRSLYDAEGQHILDLRRHPFALKNSWLVESPAGEKIAIVEHTDFLTREHANVDLTIMSENGKDNRVLHMRQKDRGAITTSISVHGSPDLVADVGIDERNNIVFNQKRGRDRSVWHLRVGPGMDLSVVLVLALCRAEMAHTWNQ